MHQNPLDFDAPTAPYQGHSQTSKAAASSVLESLNAGQRRVREYLAACGPTGGTDEQIQAGTGMRANTERPRRIELVELGLVRDSNQRRATSSGRTATVWVLN